MPPDPAKCVLPQLPLYPICLSLIRRSYNWMLTVTFSLRHRSFSRGLKVIEAPSPSAKTPPRSSSEKVKLPLSASALPHSQPLKDKSEGYSEERGLAGGWVCTPLLPFHWGGGTAASLHLQASQKDFKGSDPCTCKCLGKCKDGLEKWGPMQPCP